MTCLKWWYLVTRILVTKYKSFPWYTYLTLLYQQVTYSMISALKAWLVLHRHCFALKRENGVKFRRLKISFSFSPLKQTRRLNRFRFVLSPFAKQLRYEMSNFHEQKYKSNWTWNQTIFEKKTVSRPKNRIKDPRNRQKNLKKVSYRCFEQPQNLTEAH